MSLFQTRTKNHLSLSANGAFHRPTSRNALLAMLFGIVAADVRMQGAVESRQGKSKITHAILTFDGEAMYTAKAGN